MAEPAGSTNSSKALARARTREQRDLRSPIAHADNDRAIALNSRFILDFLAPRSRVACYLSAPTEPGTISLVAELLDRGFEVIAPRVSGRLLDWAVVEPSSRYETGAFGIREVIGTSVGVGAGPIQVASAIFLPALAIDSQTGVRLGQGGGYYDSVLGADSKVDGSGPVRAAITYADEIWAGVPHDEHDCSVAVIITETGLVEIPGSGTRGFHSSFHTD